MIHAVLFHGSRSLKLCLDNNLGGFDLAFGYEAVARAYAVLKNAAEMGKAKAAAPRRGPRTLPRRTIAAMFYAGSTLSAENCPHRVPYEGCIAPNSTSQARMDLATKTQHDVRPLTVEVILPFADLLVLQHHVDREGIEHHEIRDQDRPDKPWNLIEIPGAEHIQKDRRPGCEPDERAADEGPPVDLAVLTPGVELLHLHSPNMFMAELTTKIRISEAIS